MGETSSNDIASGSPAITFPGLDQTWTIHPDIYVASDVNTVVSIYSGSILNNYGHVFSYDTSMTLTTAGVVFSGTGSTINNSANASIDGNHCGITINDGNTTINNNGQIAGFMFCGVVFAAPSSFDVLN